MSSESAAVPASRRTVAELTRSRAAELARVEGVRLEENVRPLRTALAAIRRRHRAIETARIRALGLERLPDADYLGHVVEQLCAELDATQSRQQWLAAVQQRADEIAGLLQRAVDMAARTDLVGQLDVPLELVGAMQTGARDGLSGIARLREQLQVVEHGPSADSSALAAPPQVVEPGSGVAAARPARSARWLVRLASRRLPGVARHRYLEEFSGELRELVEDGLGATGQVAHALRLLLRVRGLRRALADGAAGPVLEPDRVRVQTRTDGGTGRPPVGPPAGTRGIVARWRVRRNARMIVRLQARQARREAAAVLAPDGSARRARQVYGRRGVIVKYRAASSAPKHRRRS